MVSAVSVIAEYEEKVCGSAAQEVRANREIMRGCEESEVPKHTMPALSSNYLVKHINSLDKGIRLVYQFAV